MRRSLQDYLRKQWLWLSGAVLCALLLLTAGLQYRWINRLSAAEHQQRHALLATALRNVRGEFDRSLRDTMQVFRRSLGLAANTDWEAQLNTTVTQWGQDEHTSLLRAVSFAQLQKDGSVVFKRRALQEASFSETQWPAELTAYRTMLTEGLLTSNGQLPLTPREMAQDFMAAQPLLAFQLVEDPRREAELRAFPELAERPGPPKEPGDEAARDIEDRMTALSAAPPAANLRRPILKGWCFLELDATYLQNQFVPELSARYFSQSGMQGFELALLTGQPPRALYSSNGALTPEAIVAFANADAAVVLFTRRVHSQPNGVRPPGAPPLPEAPRDDETQLPQGLNALDAATDPLAWRLVVKDSAGSVALAIAQTRRRNLAAAFGVLLVLAASFALLLLAMRRVNRLAAQQLEFVAGVSHELRTPLAVIQSTSHNLAQGLVKDPQRVVQYGTTIQTEVRRLAHQLEQVLSFAGIQSGRKLYDLRAVDVKAVCERALAAHSFAAENWQVEFELSDDLPPVTADAAALESVVSNLLHNAHKYAAAGRWLRVSAQQTRHEIELTIADRGPGIAAADLPHLFEPFYRGQRVLASSVPGAGLGLSLVQRHLQAM
ncbi:MAG: HAMP domain-containing histidine kinase, partial [Acidobacteria bacterium]|nr:HAMP domain-containing histidine kinase [Acidobacteriota bacterium]